ncbi:hypothetical protein O181_063940, partial [Austropuccinia psidii MF-1]|nr:hypothetical protein [Austropuccinia psidii MF-1]
MRKISPTRRFTRSLTHSDQKYNRFNRHAAEVQSLRMQLSSPPPPGVSFQPFSRASIEDSPSLLNGRSPQENRAISHFIDALIPHNFALCIGVIPSCATEKEFFKAIKARCCPGSCCHKLKVVRELLRILVANNADAPTTNTSIVFSLHCTFAMFKKLGIEANELKGLLAQATCWAPPTLDQLITAAILTKGDEKPSSTFMHQRPTQGRAPLTTGDHLFRQGMCVVDQFGASCFHCGRAGHWRADCPVTKGLGTHYHCERVSQVQFVEQDASDKVLIDTGASIHLSGSIRFATCIRSVSPFRIFFADSNSSVLISQTMTLKLPVNGGSVLVHDVAFSDKISGTIFSVGCLCAAGVVPIFNDLKLSLFVSGFVVTTTFNNHCWWLDILAEEGTKRSVAVSPSCILPKIEMHPISKPTSTSLSSLRDHVSTYSVVYPLKAQYDAPDAILDAIRQLQVRLQLTPKALRTDNAKEFTSTSFTSSLAKLGISFFPSLPYFPQENGEAERLNWTLGDMARAMMVESQMPDCFWRFAYASACFLHNRLPNSRCKDSSPHQVPFGQPPSISTLYPFGADTVVHIPSVQQSHKLSPRGLACRLLKPLVSGGWLLWDPVGDRQIQLASVVFPHFQPSNKASCVKGSLSHIVNAATLGQVPTERYFKNELAAIDTLSVTKDVAIPENLGQALSGPLRKEWRRACKAELEQMALQDVWEAVHKEKAMKTIAHAGCSISNAMLTDPLRSLKLTWWPGVIVNDLAWTAPRRTHQPYPSCHSGFSWPTPYAATEPCCLLTLKKALYGMRQAGRCWWLFLSEILTRMGFAAMEVDQSLYIFRNGADTIAIWIHVDDRAVASNSPSAVLDFKRQLCAEVDIKWHDTIRQIVGLECAFGEGEVAISQRRLTKSILKGYPGPIVKNNCPLPVLPPPSMAVEDETLDPTPFRLVIGSLAYLVSGSRPDLAFAVNYLAQHSMALTKTRWCILDHVAAVQISIDNLSGKHMRYLDRAFFFVNNVLRKHNIKVNWILTAKMQADALTKRLSGSLLQRAIPFLCVDG